MENLFRVLVAGRLRSSTFAALRKGHRARRSAELRLALAEASPGFVFIAGDSHAEMLGSPELGCPVVNGGVGATLAHETAEILEGLAFAAPAGVAILLLGQNDTLRVNGPLTWAKRFRFRRALIRIARRLKAGAAVVMVSDIPPFRADVADGQDPAALDYCTACIREVCEAYGCVWFDAFAGVRSANGAVARDAVAMDMFGSHLADYHDVGRALRSAVEAALADAAGRPACTSGLRPRIRQGPSAVPRPTPGR